jgi:hypothetical protein
MIYQINFYSKEEKLVKMGGLSDGGGRGWGGRVVTFNIAADEQLIGCRLDEGVN